MGAPSAPRSPNPNDPNSYDEGTRNAYARDKGYKDWSDYQAQSQRVRQVKVLQPMEQAGQAGEQLTSAANTNNGGAKLIQQTAQGKSFLQQPDDFGDFAAKYQQRKSNFDAGAAPIDYQIMDDADAGAPARRNGRRKQDNSRTSMLNPDYSNKSILGG